MLCSLQIASKWAWEHDYVYKFWIQCRNEGLKCNWKTAKTAARYRIKRLSRKEEKPWEIKEAVRKERTGIKSSWDTHRKETLKMTQFITITATKEREEDKWNIEICLCMTGDPVYVKKGLINRKRKKYTKQRFFVITNVKKIDYNSNHCI